MSTNETTSSGATAATSSVDPNAQDVNLNEAPTTTTAATTGTTGTATVGEKRKREQENELSVVKGDASTVPATKKVTIAAHRNDVEENDENEDEEDEEDSDDDDDSDDEEDEEDDDDEEESLHIETDEEAEAARQIGVSHYNANQYADALMVQYQVVRYFSKKYGPTAPQSGLYFLDYGLSQLRMIQHMDAKGEGDDAAEDEDDDNEEESGDKNNADGTSPATAEGNSAKSAADRVAAALDGALFQGERDMESIQSCYVNLDVARVCFQKQETAAEKALAASPANSEDAQKAFLQYVEVQLRIGEVHNAIAQLYTEIEDSKVALTHYESEVLGYRCIQDEIAQKLQQNPSASFTDTLKEMQLTTIRRLTSAMFGIADGYIKSSNFEEAEKRAQETLDMALQLPQGTIASEIIEELRDMVEDAKESKNGKYEEAVNIVRAQFAQEEAENQPSAKQFYGVRDNEDDDDDNDEKDGEEDDDDEDEKEAAPVHTAVVVKRKKNAPVEKNRNTATSAAADGPMKNPFLSAVPGSFEGSMGEGSRLSMPHSLSHPLSSMDNTNSQSISLFPPQDSNSRSFMAGDHSSSTHGFSNGPVQRVVARKKAKGSESNTASRVSGGGAAANSGGGVVTAAAVDAVETIASPNGSGSMSPENTSEERESKRAKPE